MKKFWNWKTRKIVGQDDSFTEENILFLNGTISEESWFDDDVTPKVFKDDLSNHKGDITVWINSPGGDCIAAAQIYNMLKEHKGNVTVKVDGLAASAASVIAMAGDKVIMSPVSMMMIHNPMTFAFGDREDMKQVISMLDEVKESIINDYEIKTGIERDKISKLMSNETWMNANKALELGFADEVNKHEIEDEISPPNISNSYSEVKVMNSLMDKIKKKCKIETKNEGRKVEANSLIERLFLIKNWR